MIVSKKRKIGHGDRPVDLVAGSFYVPKPKKGRPLGDDAHFICRETQSIGVADGVGGYAKGGVDPGDYARQLMRNSAVSLLQRKIVTGEGTSPKKVLKEAYENTRIKGASTACIITLDGSNRILSFANVGDSGFMLFRNHECVYVSPKKQYYFNCPFQLTGGDKPDSNEINHLLSVGVIEVEKGDVVVAGSDGLFDNMYADEMEDILREVVGDECDTPKDVACIIAMHALANSKNAEYESPFALAARDAGDDDFSGGKTDDITVIVAYII